ncbi:hypothetical protein VTN02DRAFT_5644 [Thermoascus thermophilus]
MRQLCSGFESRRSNVPCRYPYGFTGRGEAGSHPAHPLPILPILPILDPVTLHKSALLGRLAGDQRTRRPL